MTSPGRNAWRSHASFLSLFLARKREQEFRGRQPLKQGDKQAAESGADINGRGRYDRRSDMQLACRGGSRQAFCC